MPLRSAPNPRYRLYTSLRTYMSFFGDLLAGRLSEGDHVEQLEAELCRRTGAKFAVCTPQNRVGVYLAVRSLIRPGQAVVMSPYTIADIVNMVVLAGGRPVFADVERETCNISAAEVAATIGEDTGAVLVTHLHGLAAPIEEILEICRPRNIPVIEDAAQAFGTKVAGRAIGTFGAAGVFSFGMFKNVNSWFGGAVVTDDARLAESVRSELADHEYQSAAFILKKFKKGLLTDFMTSPLLFKLLTFWVFRYAYLHDIESINKKVRTELDISPKKTIPADYLKRYTPGQARLVLSQLDHIDDDSRVRIKNALIYHETLRHIEGLIIPPERNDFSHIYTYFPIQFADREALIKHLMAQGRDVAAQHYKNCADLPWFSAYFRDCPNARRVAEELIFLPTYPRYGEQEVRRTADAINAFFPAVRRGSGAHRSARDSKNAAMESASS